MIEEALLNYGMAGIFIVYLIYDRQVLLRKITKALDALNETLMHFSVKGGYKNG